MYGVGHVSLPDCFGPPEIGSDDAVSGGCVNQTLIEAL
jgi:hypothetical protein